MSFELKTKKYIFSPKLIPTLLALICIPVLVSLGLWQLDRAEEKRVIDRGVNEAIEKPALNLNSADLKTLNAEIYRTASIKGRYATETQFLLDNRTHNGKPGYHVISPFLFEQDSNTGSPNVAILVNRGWIPYKGTRENIVDVSLIKEMDEIIGTIKKIPTSIVLNDTNDGELSSSLIFKSGTKQLQGIQLIQSIQIDRLEDKVNYKLLPVIIELDDTVENGFIREWQPYYGSIDKHNAYALQWFAMAFILLFLFLKLN